MGPDFLNRRSKKAGYSVDPHSIHNLNSDVLNMRVAPDIRPFLYPVSGFVRRLSGYPAGFTARKTVLK